MRCAMCQKEISTTEQDYVLRVDLFASADDLEVTDADLGGDTDSALKHLIDKLEDMNDGEAEEENDRVFERYTFKICPGCRDELHKILKKTRIAAE